jgi:hypothetical protein
MVAAGVAMIGAEGCLATSSSYGVAAPYDASVSTGTMEGSTNGNTDGGTDGGTGGGTGGG